MGRIDLHLSVNTYKMEKVSDLLNLKILLILNGLSRIHGVRTVKRF